MARPWINILLLANVSRPGDVADWAPHIQNAVNYLVGNPLLAPLPLDLQKSSIKVGGTIYFPPGYYAISRPVILARIGNVDNDQEPHSYLPFSITLLGESTPYGSRIHASVIQIGSSFNASAAVIIQGGNGVHIKNLVIEDSQKWTDGKDPLLITDFANDNLFAHPRQPDADDRFAPYSGICIDPFEANKGNVGYFKRFENYYSYQALTSSNVLIENCVVEGFGVAVALSVYYGSDKLPPRNDSVPLTLTRCVLQRCTVLLAIGRAVGRRTILNNSALAYAKTAIDTASFGQGTGDFPAIFGCNLGVLRNLFHTNATTGTPTIEGLFSEHTLCIGQLRRAANQPTVHYLFQGCTFDFLDYQPAGGPTLPAVNANLFNYADTTFQSCIFAPDTKRNGPRMPFTVVNGPGCHLNFEACTVSTRPSWTDPATNKEVFDPAPPFWVVGDEAGVTYTFQTIEDDRLTSPLARLAKTHMADGQGVTSTLVPPPFLSTNYLLVQAAPGAFFYQTSFVTPGANWRTSGGDGRSPLRWVSSKYKKVLLNQPGQDGKLMPIDIQANGDGTATLPVDPTIIQVNDLLAIDSPVFNADLDGGSSLILLGKVSKLDTNLNMGKVTATLTYVPQAVTTGAYSNVYLVYFPRVHPPTSATLTSGDETLRRISIAPMSGTGLTLFDSWRVGDRFEITASMLATSPVPRGAFIAELIDGTTARMSLKPRFQGAPYNVRIFDADIRTLRTYSL